MELPNWLRNPSLDYFQSQNYVVLDFETTNKEKGHPRNTLNKTVCSSWLLGPQHPLVLSNTFKSDVPYVTWGGVYEQAPLVDAVNKADFIVAHNAKFELGWLHNCGVDLYDILPFCTQVAEYIELSNRKGVLSLSACLKRRGLGGKEGVIDRMIKSGICPSELPPSLIKTYVQQDVVQTHKLFKLQLEELKKGNLLKVHQTRCAFLPMLTSLEFVGIHVSDEVIPAFEKSQEKYRELSTEFAGLTGDINFNSPKQVAEYLYETLGFEELTDRKGEPERTDKGQPKTGKDVIERLKPKSAVQKYFKGLKLQLSAAEADRRLFEKLKLCKEENDSLVHFNFNATVVRTGRLSSAGNVTKIQGHNWARSKKKYVDARNPGWKIGEADYPNLEWRVAGHYGRDSKLLSDVMDINFDVHNFSASHYGIGRQDAKAKTFQPLFGGRGQTRKDHAYADLFRERWTGVDREQRRWAMECVQHGYIEAETGWKFYWPSEITRSGWISYTTQIYDYPIQYLAGGEITLLACLHMWYLGRSLDSFMVNTVHDSDIWEIHPKEEKDWRELAIDCFTDRVYDYLDSMYGIDFFIPLGAGIKVGPQWSVGEEIKLDKPRGGEIIRKG